MSMSEIYTATEHPLHFDVKHENGEALVCMTNGGECSVLVEVGSEYSKEESAQLVSSTKHALEAINDLAAGRAAGIFTGFHIRIGEDVTEGGGRAVADDNLVLLNGRKMLMSIQQMREVSGAYSGEELFEFPDIHRPGGALEYTLVHEVGHVLDERTGGDKMHRIQASESPTNYGRTTDRWHPESKDHEAFAEGFAHMAWGMPVSEKMEQVVRATIELASIEKSGA